MGEIGEMSTEGLDTASAIVARTFDAANYSSLTWNGTKSR